MLIILTVEFMSMMIVFIRHSNTLPKVKKVRFSVGAVFIIIAACCECVGQHLNGRPNLRALHIAFKFAELSITPVIPIMSSTAVMPLKDKRLPIALLSLHTLIEFLSIWLGITFYVNDAGIYEHSRFYAIYCLAYASSIAFMLIRIGRFSQKYQNHNGVSLWLIMLFVLSGVLSQVLNDSIRVAWITAAIGYMFFWIYYCEMVHQVDILTELLNRACFENNINELKSKSVVIYFDVDNFKSINDGKGHLYGDKCLNTVGRALKSVYGRYGRCYRVGGDEFCVIMTRRISSVEELNTRFCNHMDNVRAVDANMPHVSYGFADFDPHAMDTSDAIAAADKMMYSIKKAHKCGEGRE